MPKDFHHYAFFFTEIWWLCSFFSVHFQLKPPSDHVDFPRFNKYVSRPVCLTPLLRSHSTKLLTVSRHKSSEINCLLCWCCKWTALNKQVKISYLNWQMLCFYSCDVLFMAMTIFARQLCIFQSPDVCTWILFLYNRLLYEN